MIRHITLLAALIAAGGALLTGGAAGCGQNIPDVAGNYTLTSTDCPDGLFSETVEITQSGDVITFQPLDLSGSIDINGDFNVSNGYSTCVGSFSEGTATSICSGDEYEECGLIYEKETES